MTALVTDPETRRSLLEGLSRTRPGRRTRRTAWGGVVEGPIWLVIVPEVDPASEDPLVAADWLHPAANTTSARVQPVSIRTKRQPAYAAPSSDCSPWLGATVVGTCRVTSTSVMRVPSTERTSKRAPSKVTASPAFGARPISPNTNPPTVW